MESKEIIAIVLSIIGSAGLWTFLQTVYLDRQNKKNNKAIELTNLCNGLLAVLHSMLYERCDEIIEKGYKTPEDVEELTYMAEPYFALGGDGTLEKMIKIIDTFQIKNK